VVSPLKGRGRRVTVRLLAGTLEEEKHMIGRRLIADCDIDALRFVFDWALTGSTPYPPDEGPYDCSLD
jgi:hypothetical protein